MVKIYFFVKNNSKKHKERKLIIQIIFILIGFVFLIKGADFLIKASISIAEKFNLSKMLIGLTIVAIGTSLPEIFIT